MKAFVVAVAGLLLAAPAVAQLTGESSTGTTGSSQSVEERLDEAEASANAEGGETPRRICRRVDTATGSRMNYRRVCLTADQWRNFYRN
ncbi:MAG TPA: hypothetical protein VEA60_13270 [Allosphingosinicella sp.]|nr:hypothetical protein [Allosphingosinicella sp.]